MKSRDVPARSTTTFTTGAAPWFGATIAAAARAAAVIAALTLPGPIAHGADPIRIGETYAEMAERLKKKAVFIIEVADRWDPCGEGTGYFVGSNGFAVTCHHVIEDAAASTAFFPESGERMPITVWAVEKDYDFALLHLDMRPTLCLSPAEAEPDPGELVTTLVVRGGPDRNLPLGIIVEVETLRAFQQLGIRPQSGQLPDSRWIQIDSFGEPGDSGSPVVNDFGQVIGTINCGCAPGRRMMAVSAAHLPQLFRKAISAGRITDPQRTVARDLDREVRALEGRMKCRRCKGRGKIMLPALMKPQQSNGESGATGGTREIACAQCGGTGSMQPADLRSRVCKIATTMAGLDSEDEGSTNAIASVKRALTTLMERHGTSVIANAFNGDATFDLARAAIDAGEPTMFLGRLLPNASTSRNNDKVHRVQLLNSSQTILFRDLMFVDADGSELVLAGGLLAGYVLDSNGKAAPVLSHGLIFGAGEPEPNAAGSIDNQG